MAARLETNSGALDPVLIKDATEEVRLVGQSPSMRRIQGNLERLRGSLAAVLITGESGTGKEVVARAIHQLSRVANGPFVAVNCGALDRALARSELFGHARGSFTGAVDSRPGAFEAASTGTLFLDEVGELPLDIQPILLRALEQNTVQRVGDTIERKVKVRVLSATNRNLEELVARGTFREDLYYRLLVVQLSLPPLRERREDIPELVRTFLAELGHPSLPADVMNQLLTRPWPGNIRQLKNAIHAYAAVGTLTLAERRSDHALDAAFRGMISMDRTYAELKELVVERFMRLYVELLMSHTNGNQTDAARISGIDRSHLNRMLRRLT